MSKRVEILYDDGATIAFNKRDEAIYHLYAQGLMGVVCLREEADWERIGQLRAARTAMDAAGIPTKGNRQLSEPEAEVLLNRASLDKLVTQMQEDSDVPTVREGSRANSNEELAAIEAGNDKALKAARRLLKETE